MIYMIENGFADPVREPDWDSWYTRHVIDDFPSVPGWRTGQRFIALPPSHPKYRAMYTWDSDAVLSSPEYKATTGGRFPQEWREAITDFRRNLADGDMMPSVEKHQCLVVVDSPVSGAALDEVALQWWNIVDLDRSVERRAIGIVDRAVGESISRRSLIGVGVYIPMFDRYIVKPKAS